MDRARAGLALGAIALGAAPGAAAAEPPPDVDVLPGDAGGDDANIGVPDGGDPVEPNPAPMPDEDIPPEEPPVTAPPATQPAPPPPAAQGTPAPVERPAPPPAPGLAPPAKPPPRPARKAPPAPAPEARHPSARSAPPPLARRARLPQAPPPVARAASGSRTPPPRSAHSDSYRVQAGDTLWSLAAARLGPGASAARIAHEVDRLWSLNRDRIASGDPDLIRVGERLRLE